MAAPPRHPMRVLAVSLLTAALFITAACSGGSSDLTDALSGSTKGAVRTSDDPTGGADQSAVRTYGYGPSAAPGVTYQPDVVMVPSGPAAIRGASDDGVVWTLDAHAAGVADVKVGSVLVASGRATGRVVDLQDRGDTRVVTLAPVEITEIVRDGKIDLKQTISADDITFQSIPAAPGGTLRPLDDSPTTTIVGRPDTGVDVPALASPRGGTTAHASIGAPRAPLGARADGTLPPASEGSAAIPAGDYTITPGYKANELYLDIERDGSLKVGVHFGFAVSELSVDSGMSISGGVSSGARMLVNGITGLEVSLSAGAAGGSADNEKVRLELPMDFSIPIPPSPATAGLPLVVKIQFVYSIETAITGNNSTLVATGIYGLSGPIGVQNGSVVAPEFSVKQSIIDSISGITLGPSGVVFAVKMKVQAALGIPVASAGPFGSVTTSVGITNGSSLGAPLARCRSASLDMEVGGGVSFSLSTPVLDALKMCACPTVEVHISNIHKRAETEARWRADSIMSPAATGMIAGLGVAGYELAVEFIARRLKA